ncbi:MAG: hypothetical protein CMB99_03160 [Flavobacteriaceae bacterium]|nr:hypothetical protein [Flavobacteriaceae bacterium]|tara:strand:- start:54972 stop:55778 length:807 start_codon:yes stop_codon:yes gene_type:complete
MKNIWNKIPAWIKVILINCVVMYPVIILIQSTVVFNLQSGSEIPWALAFTMVVLFGFWKLVQRFTNFNQPEDVKIKMDLNLSDSNVWFRIVGIILITISAISLFSFLFKDVPEEQLAFFKLFENYSATLALPLLFSVALTAGVVEETVYRGIIQNTLVRTYPKIASFIGIAVLFALMHFLPVSLILAYLFVSTSFSFIADEFKSLGAVITAHVLVDVIVLFTGYYMGYETTNEQVIPLLIAFVVGLFFLLYKNPLLQGVKARKLEVQS